ncbi:hypothetical protein AB0Q95_29895 [Streptomyces sp. NPDC059900]|uniref:hypothetical protein n=1 Tax=Streptomyces sp. NPDC059900 TaxID=3155816 RepID=UPI00342A7888
MSFAEVVMPSVLGLLEAREKNVREEVTRLEAEAERVQAALGSARVELSRLAEARATVTEVLSRVPDEAVGPVSGALAGSVVPERVAGMGVQVLAVEYQQILSVLAGSEATQGLRVKPIALQLGGEVTPARIEGVRSRVKRLVARGWAAEVRPNVFTLPVAANAG